MRWQQQDHFEKDFLINWSVADSREEFFLFLDLFLMENSSRTDTLFMELFQIGKDSRIQNSACVSIKFEVQIYFKITIKITNAN